MGFLQDVIWKHHQGHICEKNLPPLIFPNLTTNTQACYSSIQVSSGSKAEEINNIYGQKVVPIFLQVTRNDDPMVVLREKGMQQSSRNVVLWDAAYDTVRKITVSYFWQGRRRIRWRIGSWLLATHIYPHNQKVCNGLSIPVGHCSVYLGSTPCLGAQLWLAWINYHKLG